jgi:hypothetical protein
VKVKNLIAGAALAVGLAFGAGAQAGPLVVGAPADGGNCYPFGCAVLWAPQYQQVYASADFTGTMTITDLVFYDSFNGPGAPVSGTYTIDLSVTSAPVNGLDLTNLSNNIGSHDQVVFSGSLPAFSGDELILPLSTPYTYNPSGGNLLMNVYSPNVSGGSLFLDARNGSAGDLFSRAMTPGGGATGNDGWGLVTGFTIAVPEPATWSMLILGVAMIGFAARRRREGIAAAA